MAESVAHYLKDPELLQSRSLPKYEFIRDRIMHGTRYISKIPDHLTFEVLNLFPDYDYPGKIKRLDVKVTGAPDEDKTVTLEIELNHLDGFEDGASNAKTRISSPLFIDSEGNKRTQYYDMWLYPVNGNDHLLRGTITVSKYSKTGYWVAGDIVIGDLQGNQRFAGRNDYVWNMYINNPIEDIIPPKYVKNSLNYQLSDTVIDGHDAQNLRVTYQIDENIGIMSVYSNLIRGNDHGTACYGNYDHVTKTATIDIPITEFYPEADYYITSAIFADLAHNTTYQYFTDSPLDEPIKKIHIKTPNPDTEAPEVDLNRITVHAEPTHPEAPDGETVVTITYFARDNKSGLGLVTYSLRDPQGINHFQYHYHRNFYTQYFDGDPTVWEKYTITCILPQGSAPGIWGLAEFSVHDKAGNNRIYNFVETIIFEPDNSTTDYVLFSELDKDNVVKLQITTDTQAGFGFKYRIINEDTGEEVSGEVNSGSFRSATHTQTVSVDVSGISDGKLIVIVQVKDAEGKVEAVRSSYVVKGLDTGLKNVRTESKMTVYPNPVSNRLYIKSVNPVLNVKIYNSAGVCVVNERNIETGINVSKLPTGLYIVEIKTDSENTTRELLKQ